MKAPTGDQPYTLYGLGQKPDSTVQFSPFVWKVIIALRYLGVDYKLDPRTFTSIRTDLWTKFKDEVRVPVLEDAEGGWMRESFEIALYLDRTHAVPKGKSLFLHGVGGRELCRFINFWTDTVLAPDVGAMVRPRTCNSLPESSDCRTYFANSRFGSQEAATAKYEATLSASSREEKFGPARRTLKLLDTMLAFQRGQGKKFIGGEFSYADAAVFGLYMWCVQFTPECREEVWENAENPAVKEWVGEMRGLPGWQEGDFNQIKQ